MVERVAAGGAHQPPRAFARDGLDPVGGALREADLAHPHLLAQESAEFLRLRRAGLPLDAGVDVLRVLTEDHHVHPLRVLHGRLDAAEPADRAQADVEVEALAQGYVERTDAAADRGRQRALDADLVVAEGLHGLVRQVGPQAVKCLLACGQLFPFEPAGAAIGLGHGGVQDAAHRGGHLGPHAVAGDVWDGLRDHFDRVLRAEPARNQAICCGE